MMAYTWLGSHMLEREGEKQYPLNGSPERSDFVTFGERTVLGAFSQQASALCMYHFHVYLPDPAEVTWARLSVAFLTRKQPPGCYAISLSSLAQLPEVELLPGNADLDQKLGRAKRI